MSFNSVHVYLALFTPSPFCRFQCLWPALWYWFDAPYSLHLYIIRVSGIGVSGKFPKGFVSFVYSCHLNNTFHIISIKMRAFYWFLHSNTNRISTLYQYQTVFGWFTIFYNTNDFFVVFMGNFHIFQFFFSYIFSVYFSYYWILRGARQTYSKSS